MSAEVREVAERFNRALNTKDSEAASALLHPEAVFDWSRSIAPYRDVITGREAVLRFWQSFLEIWDEWAWDYEIVEELADDRMIVATHVQGRGRESGLEIDARGAQLVSVRDGLIAGSTLFQSVADARGFAARSALVQRLRAARLYFVCEGRPGGEDPGELLDAVLRGGADVIQLREKAARTDDELVELAQPFRRAATEHGALFFVNDRPDLVAPCSADGVHVGQDDAGVHDARTVAGPASLVGLSTHSAAQFDAAATAPGEARPDQISVGPVWETPTKRGRPAAGLELVEHAALASHTPPWFAIGGIDLDTVAQVKAAGATRAVVVRAIRDAADPEAAARSLREALDG